jgi:hypothetical protein
MIMVMVMVMVLVMPMGTALISTMIMGVMVMAMVMVTLNVKVAVAVAKGTGGGDVGKAGSVGDNESGPTHAKTHGEDITDDCSETMVICLTQHNLCWKNVELLFVR